MTKEAILTGLLLTILLFVHSSFGQEDRSFPIPKFMYPEQNVTSVRLDSVMEEMAEHLCRRQDPPPAGWQTRYDELLSELIVAENAVVWAAAADFAPDERIALGEYYKVKDEILRLFDKLIPDNEQLKAPANKLRTGGDPYTNVAAGAKFGRGIFTIYALRSLLQDVHRHAWQTMASVSEGSDYNSLVKRALGILGSVEYRMYDRGLGIVQQKTAGAEFRFSLYQTPDTLRDSVQVATIQKFLSYAGLRGLEAARLAEFDREFPWQTAGTLALTPFGGRNQTDLRGRCFEPSVKVLYQRSRKADAEAAEELLRRNNFKVELTELREDADLPHKQKVYYQNKGSRRGAESISDTLKKVETLNAFQGNTSQTPGAPDYSVWIVKKPETKAHSIKVNYTTERRLDGERAIARLREEGYLVIFAVVGNEENMEYKSGKLLYRSRHGATSGEATQIAEIVRSIEPLTPDLNSTTKDKVSQPYELWFVTKKEDAALNLNGLWLGYNYQCPGDGSIQEIRITQTGADVIAIKVSGNKCIGDGETTFRGTLVGRNLTGEMNNEINGKRVFRTSRFEIRNKDLIVIDGRIEIRRKVD